MAIEDILAQSKDDRGRRVLLDTDEIDLIILNLTHDDSEASRTLINKLKEHSA